MTVCCFLRVFYDCVKLLDSWIKSAAINRQWFSSCMPNKLGARKNSNLISFKFYKNSLNMGAKTVACVVVLMMASYMAYATDPTQLQDFCVGINDPNAAVFVNGLFCKNPMKAKPEDFTFKGLNVPGDTDNRVGFDVNLVSAANLPGLNTLGISLARLDFAPYGLNPLHTHPRATEILTVMEGTLYVGFVTSNQADGSNKLFAKVLYPGDVFVFPQGLIHFQFNVGKTKAVAFAGLSSQNPGTVTIANAVFGSTPPISVDVLAKAFQLDANMVKKLQAAFGSA